MAKEAVPNLSLIHYVTDGAASQYKNKLNFHYLAHHHKDFKVKANWVFHSTSHGKGAHDGVGGTVKRMLRNEMLKGKIINDSKTAFNILKDKFDLSLTKIKPIFLEKADIEKMKLPQRIKTIERTQSYHIVTSIENTRNLHFKETVGDNGKIVTFA